MRQKVCFFFALMLTLSFAPRLTGSAGSASGKDDGKYVGNWHSMNAVAAGFAERYAFYDDGTFIYGSSEMDYQAIELYRTGTWRVEGDELWLSIETRLATLGGTVQVTEDGDIFIRGGEVTEILVNPPMTLLCAIAETGADSETGRSTIEIDGLTLYNFDNQHDLMDGYYGLLAAASVRFVADGTGGYTSQSLLDCGRYFINGHAVPDEHFRIEIAEDGIPALMILLDAHDPRGGANDNLALSVYGSPLVGKYGSDINLVFSDPEDTESGIMLTFQNGNSEMWVQQNTPKGVLGKGDGYPVEMGVQVVDDGSGGNRFFVPLLPILDEVGGGILSNLLDDGMIFIYIGDESATEAAKIVDP